MFKKKPYDRRRHLDAAEKARGKGRKGKAIAEYRKVLEVTPNDYAVHLRIAPLLVAKGRLDEAWTSYQISAEGQMSLGFIDRALAVHRQAAQYFPTNREVWETIAKLNVQRGRPAEAVKVLVGAERSFRGRSLRPEAVLLLRRALLIEPHHPAATMLLARVLARSGEKAEARALLDDLVERVIGPRRRKVRALQLRLHPSPGALWRWLAGR